MDSPCSFTAVARVMGCGNVCAAAVPSSRCISRCREPAFSVGKPYEITSGAPLPFSLVFGPPGQDLPKWNETAGKCMKPIVARHCLHSFACVLRVWVYMSRGGAAYRSEGSESRTPHHKCNNIPEVLILEYYIVL